MKWSKTEINVFSTMLLFAINLLTQYLIEVVLITFDLPHYFINQYTTGVSPTSPGSKSTNIQTTPVNQLFEPVVQTNQSTPVPDIKITEEVQKEEITVQEESEVKGNLIVFIKKCVNEFELKESIRQYSFARQVSRDDFHTRVPSIFLSFFLSSVLYSCVGDIHSIYLSILF